ncbi:NAD(+) diphosphatase [Microbacterium sp.]|uniref:NAD(+) diphosphatase n=1 Tax=Microbacterium sp. TaxID=51671 RepID=UPI0028114501|nr:NAD(+) diphosphatase [Microbacterium sp.]
MVAPHDTVGRAPELRVEPGVLDRLRADGSSRAVVVRDGRVRLDGDTVRRVAAADVGDAEWALLGRDVDGAAVLLASVVPTTPEPPEAAVITTEADAEERWLGLREVGGLLGPREWELLVSAVALAGWLRDTRFCPACGHALEVRQAGWSKWCPQCGSEHFPRTDPAVIVAVESPDGERLLLGANANWGGRMHSCFAGFVEAGESLESTIHRELAEEAGVRLGEVSYVASQPWPFPRSLMIGFRAVAVDDDARADGEEIIDVRWLTRAEIGSSLAGDGPVGLPSESSIARRLIRDWYEGRGRGAANQLSERSESKCGVLSERSEPKCGVLSERSESK